MGDGLRKDFQFGKTSIEVEDVKELIKQHGISNIPYVMVFAPDGTYLTGFSATFKKMDVVKKNLATIAATRSPRYMLDPNGFVLPAQ